MSTLQLTEPKLSGFAWSGLEKECFSLTGSIKQDRTAAKNFTDTVKNTKSALQPILREIRDRLNAQGTRNDRTDTPKVGWQAWVRANKTKLGFSLATANRVCGDKPEKKVKVVVLKEDMILSFYGKQYRIVHLPEKEDFKYRKTNNEVEANYLVTLGLRPVEEPAAPVKGKKKGPKVLKGRARHYLTKNTAQSLRGSAVRREKPGFAGRDTVWQITEESPTEGGMRKMPLFIASFDSEADRDLVMERMQQYRKCGHSLTKDEREWLRSTTVLGHSRPVSEWIDKVWPARFHASEEEVDAAIVRLENSSSEDDEI